MSGYAPLQTWRRVPAGVWVLGVVSLLMDVSSEVVAPLLPLYLTQQLMIPVVAVGLLEGVAVATASATRFVAGALSDRWRHRKWMAVLGYGLSAASRPLFPIADSLVGIRIARMLDRVGKGVRGAPRDALVADMSPADARGASFGVRKALDTVGGFLGPLLAIASVAALNGDMMMPFLSPLVPILAVTYGAMTALCLAMPRHYQRIAPEPAPPPVAPTVRAPGWVLLAAGFAGAVSSFGWAIGPVAWTGALSVAALALVLGLWPWAPRVAVGLAILLTLAGVPALLV